MSNEAVKASICPGMGVCHLGTGVQVIIPMQIEPRKIVEALEAILNAIKNNIVEGIGCSQIACMMSNDVGARRLYLSAHRSGNRLRAWVARSTVRLGT